MCFESSYIQMPRAFGRKVEYLKIGGKNNWFAMSLCLAASKSGDSGMSLARRLSREGCDLRLPGKLISAGM